MRRRIQWLGLCATALLCAALPAAENLLQNGDFEGIDEESDRPLNWILEQKEKTEFVKEGKNHWFKFKDGGRLKCLIDVKPEWKWVRVAAQMRTSNVKPGAEAWNLPRIALTWTTKDKPVYQGIDQLEDMDWFQREAAFEVPKDALKLQVELGVFDCQATLEIDDVSLTSVTPEEAKKANERDWRQKHTVMLKNGKFEYGTFELLKKDGKPQGWQDNSNCKVVADGANHYAEVASNNETWSNFETRLRVRPEWSGLKISARMKVKGLKLGKEGWQTSRIAFTFVDMDDQKVGDWPPSLELKADCDWVEQSKTLNIPQGSYALKISAGLHNASGTFDFDDIKVEPVMGAGLALADTSNVSSTARRSASQAPSMKLQTVGIEFNADMAQKLLVRRIRPEGTPSTLLSVGPGCPGLAPAPKERDVKFPSNWKVVDTPPVLGGDEASPDALLLKLPDVLQEKKPEVVLLWGDAEGKRNPKPTERYDWEDVITVCLRMGVLPVMVLPNGQVNFSGGGGDVGLIAQPKKEEKEEAQGTSADLEALRRTMISVGGSVGIPMVEQAPFATTKERLEKTLYLVEKHILGRTPPERKAEPGKADTKKPGVDENE